MGWKSARLGYVTKTLIHELSDFRNHWITTKALLTVFNILETKNKWRAPPMSYYGNLNVYFLESYGNTCSHTFWTSYVFFWRCLVYEAWHEPYQTLALLTNVLSTIKEVVIIIIIIITCNIIDQNSCKLWCEVHAMCHTVRVGDLFHRHIHIICLNIKKDLTIFRWILSN